MHPTESSPRSVSSAEVIQTILQLITARELAQSAALLQAVAKGRQQIVLPRRIGWLSRLLDCLPDALHDRILRNQPRKPRLGEAGATAIPGLSQPPARH